MSKHVCDHICAYMKYCEAFPIGWQDKPVKKKTKEKTMPCTYDPDPKEIEEERQNVEMAFKLACKAMGLLQDEWTEEVLKQFFSKDELAWFRGHLEADIKREKETARRKKEDIKRTEEEVKELQSKLKKLKGK